MRIAHVLLSRAVAGVEHFLARLTTEQLSHGDEVVVVADDPVGMRHCLPADIRFVPTSGPLAMIRAVRRVAPDVDIVNAHMTHAELAAALALRSTSATPGFVATRHFASVRWANSPVLGPVARRTLPIRPDAQIAVSRFVAAGIEGPSVVVHPGVAVTAAPDRGDARTVLMAQRLESEKHVADGIAAFAASSLPGLGWSLRIAGGGSQRRDLQKYAAGLAGGEAIDFLGHVTDLPAEMRAAAVFLAPAPGEHFGLSVLEAMACALPCVVAAAGGHLETVGGDPHAAMFPPGDVAAAAACLDALAADASTRTSYGLRLMHRQRAHFTTAEHYRRTDAVYRSVL